METRTCKESMYLTTWQHLNQIAAGFVLPSEFFCSSVFNCQAFDVKE